MLRLINRLHKKAGCFVFCLALAVFLLSLGLTADAGQAQRRYYREQWKLPEFYPRGFDGYGIIDRINNNEVVISDSFIKLSPKVKLNTPRSKNTSDYHFTRGKSVAYLLNENREIESLWLITPP